MSDYFVSYIPCDPYFTPTENHTRQLASILIPDCETILEIEEAVSFADAGTNFERVTCPNCHNNILDWWPGAMNSAYTPGKGFSKLSISTPCCGYKSTLNDLIYHFPQGFYRTRILTKPDIHVQINTDKVCAELKEITGVAWRAIHQHI